jgi:hypothetical protein
LHVLSNLRAKQSIAPAKPTVHIAYTMKIGHAFDVSIVEVESSKTKPIGCWFLRKLYWLTKDMSQNNPVTITGKY